MKYLMMSLVLVTSCAQASTLQLISDELAYKYCKSEKKSLIVIIWPIAQGKLKEIKQILNSYGTIKYQKDIYFTPNKARYILAREHPMVANLEEHLNQYFPEGTYERPAHVFVWKCSSQNIAIACKYQVRMLYKKLGYKSIHINDDHKGTIVLAQYLLR